MKIRINLDHLPQSGLYTSLDVVTGSIQLFIDKGLSLSELVVSLRGVLQLPPGYENSQGCPAFGPQPPRAQKVRVMSTCTDGKGDPGTISVDNKYQLFETSQTLFPTHPLSPSSRYKLGNGQHEFSFGIDFPLLSRCFNIGRPQYHKVSNDLLITQLNFSDANRTPFRLVYVLQATAKKCGTFRLDRTASTRLPFILLDQPNFRSTLPSQPRRDCQIIPCGNLRPDAEEVGDAQLPAYTPAVFTEASITSAEPLRPGASVPLRLVITVPAAIAKELDLRLTCIRLALRKTTVLLVEGGSRCETRLSEIAIAPMTKTNLHVSPHPRDDTFEVDPRWWKDCTIPYVTPEVSPRIMEQEYWLQILGGFYSETTSMSTFVTLLLPVVLSAGESPPTYDP